MSGEGRAYSWAQRTLIAIGAIGVLGAVALVMLLVGTMWWRPNFEPARVETAKPGRGYTIGDVSAITGTPLVRINVSEGERSGGSSYYSYSAEDLRNVLVLDGASGRSWLLLPDNDHRIDRSAWFPAVATGVGGDQADLVETASGERRKDQPIVYFMFLVTGTGGHDVVVGTIDGSRRQTVMRGIDGIDGSWMRDSRHLAMVVRERGKLSYRLIDMEALLVVGMRWMGIE